MVNVKLRDDVKQFENGITAGEIAKSIGAGLYKAVCVCKIDGEVMDLRTKIEKDCEVEFLTFDDEEGKKAFRHTASHILAQAVKRLYPEAKLAIGPAIDKGFYYDFDVPKAFSPEELEKIEAEMKKIVKEGLELQQFEMTPDEAIKFYEEKGEIYKVELIKEHADKGENISFYKQGEFTELCAGPHIPDTSRVKAFKLTSCTGAYWRGDEKNKMLQRIYGTAFLKQADLDAYLEALEEAKRRDHNKLGRDLEIFTTVDTIGQGLPILLPKGCDIIQTLQRFVEDEERRRGWVRTKTPLMAKSDLYKISGHWDHYKDGMFVLGDEEKDDEVFALRPMTCPFQYQAYLNRARSYRDLPMRLAETSTLFRNEASGEMHGLIRVRQFTISEGHLMCTPEQLSDEFRRCLELTTFMLKTLGLYEDVSYRFSQWDPEDKEKYIGTPEQWDEAQGMMKEILDNLGLQYKIGIGEAAFYGPKLDIQIKNVHGKEDTLITIQIDQMLAEKFGMEYVAADGTKKNPYIIHRTSIGCYERTLALLIEKYAGAFPLWLAPEQVRILPIADRHQDAAYAVKSALEEAGIVKVDVDTRSEKLGYKLREAQLEKIPYMLVIGDKEAEDGTVSVRKRAHGDQGVQSIADFIKLATEEIETRVIW
ncbi:MAG: threonine--tRNA ligase [Clostridia bacterium]|nr:threonine--tRNA ligase [Clostridia bacterium]